MKAATLELANDLAKRISHAKDILTIIEKSQNYIEEHGICPQLYLRIQVYDFGAIDLISKKQKDQFLPFTMEQILKNAQAHTKAVIEKLEKDFSTLKC